MPIRFSRVCAFLFFSLGVANAQWRPITSEDLSTKQTAADPNADAIALFRDVRVLNEAATFGYPYNVIQEYVRLKIFTTKGRDDYGTVRIAYWGKTVIYNVAGRTIQPDGSVVELKKEDVFDKVIEQKKGGPKVQAISFAMPAVEPGSIIEYKYTRNVGEFISRYVPIEVQSEFPVRELDLHIKPVSWPPMHYLPFRCNVQLQNDVQDFTGLVVRDIPAFHDESYGPPELNAKQWILLYYEGNDVNKPDKYWAALARDEFHEYNPQIKIDGHVRQIAAEETAGAKTDEEKVDKLFEYCRKNLKDVHGTEITTEEKEKAKENHNTANTINNREGTMFDIKLAFIALATAAGFEAHIVRLSDRSGFIFDPKIPSAYFLGDTEVAVKVGGGWRFYNLENRWMPPGQLPWQQQGVSALVEDSGKAGFVTTPLLSDDKSVAQRIAMLKLSAEGALEGDIREIYAGNKATEFRERFGLANDAERESMLKDELKQRFSEFEVTGVKFTLSADYSKPTGLIYHINIPNYVQRTGKRMFVNPGYFTAGEGARFVDTSRKLPVVFPYPWSETDYVELQLPDGYQLDHADSPAPLKMALTLTYSVTMSVTKTNKLIYQRGLNFGGNAIPMFDPKNYPAIKQAFDHIHDSDNYMLTLKSDNPVTAEAH